MPAQGLRAVRYLFGRVFGVCSVVGRLGQVIFLEGGRGVCEDEVVDVLPSYCGMDLI